MALKEIPREEWKRFFEDVSRQYESGLASVEVRGHTLPQQEIIANIPLIGISYEDKGSGQGRIDLIFGSDTDNNVSHTIASPTAVKVEQKTPDGNIDTLLIDAEEGEPVTLVHFLSSI